MKKIAFIACMMALALPQSVWGACPIGEAASACTLQQMMGMQEGPSSSVHMCFQSVAFLKDNGSCSTDKTSSSCYDRDTLFTGPVEFDVMNLGSGLDLSSNSDVTFGTLTQSTNYPCAVANVTYIVLTLDGGEQCSVSPELIGGQGENFPSDFFSNMYMRGTEDCPGTESYPTTYPLSCGTDSSASFKFNVEFGNQGAPRFVFKPSSGGCSIDTSNVSTLTVTASGAAATGEAFAGVFVNVDPEQSSGGPDGGGTTCSVGSGTVTCSLAVKPGTVRVGVFQDTNSSGPNVGPDAGDLLCLTESVTVSKGEAATATCTLSDFSDFSGEGH